MSDKNDLQTKYDVFVSFRGHDIRRGFLSHLRAAFKRKQINVFVDDQLERGDEIWASLVAAIEASFISLIIFSQSYASSCWCLDELVAILHCKEKYKRIIIPVFYEVEPTHVRHQSSESYKSAFDYHKTMSETKVQLWRDALNQSATISGVKSSTFKDDAELVEEIVEKIVKLVMMRIGNVLVNSEGLVGIEQKIADIESLIRKEPKNTCLIGIWGMVGIGKTTLAQEVFNKLRCEYEGSYFLANEREQAKKNEISCLQGEIIAKLLGDDTKIGTQNSFPNDRIRSMKVLIVLDDMNKLDHLEKLLGTLDNFGSGSRIIVTTGDQQVLYANKANEIYQLGEFSSDDALELFKLNAFNHNDDQREYDELSKRVVRYAQGIPLVVKVLARRLCGKDKQVWESELHKLKRMPLRDVYDIMKLSYDDLDRKEQQIFLDLACFFLRLLDTDLKVSCLKSLLRDGEGDNSVVVGLERLKDKALITFSKDKILSMHDRLQEMALEIVCRESEDPGSRSRLWDPNDIDEALTNDKGSLAIRSILLHLPRTNEEKLYLHTVAKMSRLRFLEISCVNPNQDMSWSKLEKAWSVDIAAEGPKFWTSELMFLSWNSCPLKSLPEDFISKKLVILKLHCGDMEKLWDGLKNLMNLKEVDLSYSRNLKDLPDLSKAKNLEILVLRGCGVLNNVHPSIFSLPKLEKLDLWYCCSLRELGGNSHLSSLRYLNLDWCTNLREFSLISENIEELRLKGTKFKELPSSFGHQSKLKSLHLSESGIETLPSSFKNLKLLIYLDVQKCIKLHTLPELPPSLETLNARDCKSLKSVLFPSTPDEQLKENRKRMVLLNCPKLDEHSLASIGFNSQINLMKFANHHLSHNHVQSYDDYEHNYRAYQAYYSYPGSSVPEWLKYKTTTRENYIIMDLSSAPPSPKWGFIFGFVMGKYTVEVDISISNDVEGESESIGMWIKGRCEKIESDYVCVMYDQRCSDFLNSRLKNQTRFKITFGSPQQEIFYGFGVSPINSTTYNSFISQMEVASASYHPRHLLPVKRSFEGKSKGMMDLSSNT